MDLTEKPVGIFMAVSFTKSRRSGMFDAANYQELVGIEMEVLVNFTCPLAA